MSGLVLSQTSELIFHLSMCRPRTGSLPSSIHYKTLADLTHMGWWIFWCLLLLSLFTTATGWDDCLKFPSFSSHHYSRNWLPQKSVMGKLTLYRDLFGNVNAEVYMK